MPRLLALLAVLACIGAGAGLAHLKNENWGWFLFVGLLLYMNMDKVVPKEKT